MTHEPFHAAFSYEMAVLDQFCYRQKNAHRRAPYYQYLNQVKKQCRLIDLRSISQPIVSKDLSINQSVYQSIDQLRDILHKIYRTVKLLYQLIEQTYFMPFALTGSAILARIHHMVTHVFCQLIKQTNDQSSDHSIYQSDSVLEALRKAASLYPSSNQLFETINQSIDQSLEDRYLGEALAVIDARPVFDIVDDSMDSSLTQSIDDLFSQSLNQSSVQTTKPSSKSPLPTPAAVRPVISVKQSIAPTNIDDIPMIDEDEDLGSPVSSTPQLVHQSLRPVMKPASISAEQTRNQPNNKLKQSVLNVESSSDDEHIDVTHSLSPADESDNDKSLNQSDDADDEPSVPLFMMKRPTKPTSKSSVKPSAKSSVKPSVKLSIDKPVKSSTIQTKRPLIAISGSELPAKKLKMNQSSPPVASQPKPSSKSSAKQLSSNKQPVKQSSKTPSSTKPKPVKSSQRSPSPQSDFDDIDAIFGS